MSDLIRPPSVIWSVLLICMPAVCASDELLHVGHGNFPVVISAPHGGNQSMADVPSRTGDGLKAGPSGFVIARDSGTEELALLVVEQLSERLQDRPSFVISRVHRRYVDFNRPPEIAVEHPRARVVYDAYHRELAAACTRIQQTYGRGLLLDLHGQGSSSHTVFRGTQNGLTVTGLRTRFGPQAHHGNDSLFELLRQQGWTVHPETSEQREQSGFTGGYIVQTYGSHRAQGIDAVQLEFGSRYRTAQARQQTADQLVTAILKYAAHYLPELQHSPESQPAADAAKRRPALPVAE